MIFSFTSRFSRLVPLQKVQETPEEEEEEKKKKSNKLLLIYYLSRRARASRSSYLFVRRHIVHDARSARTRHGETRYERTVCKQVLLLLLLLLLYVSVVVR